MCYSNHSLFEGQQDSLPFLAFVKKKKDSEHGWDSHVCLESWVLSALISAVVVPGYTPNNTE